MNQLERCSRFFNCCNHNFPGMNVASIQSTFWDGYLFYKLKLGVKKFDIYYSLFQVFQKEWKIFEENPTGFYLYYFSWRFCGHPLTNFQGCFYLCCFCSTYTLDLVNFGDGGLINIFEGSKFIEQVTAQVYRIFFLHVGLQTLLKFRTNMHRTCYCYHILSVAFAVSRLLANFLWKLSFFLAYHLRKNWSVA